MIMKKKSVDDKMYENLPSMQRVKSITHASLSVIGPGILPLQILPETYFDHFILDIFQSFNCYANFFIFRKYKWEAIICSGDLNKSILKDDGRLYRQA